MFKKLWKKLVELIKGKIEDKLGDYAKDDKGESPNIPNIPNIPQNPEDSEPSEPSDEVQFSLLNWNRGGVDGSKAVIDPSVKIGSLSLNNEGMRYRWISGGCENFGASDKSDYSKTLACIFYKDSSGKWTGGKFDWVSTSRTTRDFKNVHGGYNHWDGKAFDAAKEFCFLIASANGKKRTNVIKFSR